MALSSHPSTSPSTASWCRFSFISFIGVISYVSLISLSFINFISLLISAESSVLDYKSAVESKHLAKDSLLSLYVLINDDLFFPHFNSKSLETKKRNKMG